MKWLNQLWVLLLTTMLLTGMGLQGLPVPCQNGQCGTGGCATSFKPCPPSCTCHFADDGADRCCHPGKTLTGTVADAGLHHQAPLPNHAGHAAKTAAAPDHGATHVAHPDGQTGHAALTTAADHHSAVLLTSDPPHSHCAPGERGTSWPHLSLPKVRLAALLPTVPVSAPPAFRATVSRTREQPRSRVLDPHLRPPDA